MIIIQDYFSLRTMSTQNKTPDTCCESRWSFLHCYVFRCYDNQVPNWNKTKHWASLWRCTSKAILKNPETIKIYNKIGAQELIIGPRKFCKLEEGAGCWRNSSWLDKTVLLRKIVASTRKHSSRMGTAHLSTICVSTTRRQYQWGLGVLKSTILNKSPVMATRCHQQVALSQVWFLRCYTIHQGQWSHGDPLPVDRWIHTCENITFPQLRWRPITIHVTRRINLIWPGRETYVI